MLWSRMLGLGFIAIVSAQFTPQCNNYASHATITPEQATAAGIDNTTANNVAVALNFERSNWAHGFVEEDDFYTVPVDSANVAAGTLLKVQVDANASLYTIPPNTAISRILFQSKTLNGTLIPGSAYILWPYIPRKQPDGYPIVAWAHGNSGVFAECASSHLQYLSYKWAAPYALALEGYVVVAPDYQGLGVSKDANGNPILSTQFNSPGHANDLFYSVEAAQKAFSVLSSEFVVMGHSEGGGAAWAAAERQAVHPVSGYLGSIAGSPITNILATAIAYGTLADDSIIGVVPALEATFPSFNISDVLTPAGIARFNLGKEIQGCNAVSSVLNTGTGLVNPLWKSSFYPQAYENLTMTGGKNISGPMLVLQGESDTSVPTFITAPTINKTCEIEGTQINYLTFVGVTHVPVLYASQRLWIQWITDRFAGVKLKKGCQAMEYSSALPYAQYQTETNWYTELATQSYETA